MKMSGSPVYANVALGAALKEFNRRFGIEISDYNIEDFLFRIHLARKDCGFDSTEQFLTSFVSNKLSQSYLDTMISRVFNNESYFFRHREQLEAVRSHILTQLVKNSADSEEPVRIWHAGCAHGEEPYSTAIMLASLLEASPASRVEILATDINIRNLIMARDGLYTHWHLREISPLILNHYFKPEGDKYRLAPSIRSRVKFIRQNLMDASEMRHLNLEGPVHLIFCRNVLIYFSKDQAAMVLKMFMDTLAEGGYLVLSPSENLFDIEHRFNQITLPETTIFRKGALEKPDALVFGTPVPQETEPPFVPEVPAQAHTAQVVRFKPASKKEIRSEMSMAMSNAKNLAHSGDWQKALAMLKPFEGIIEADLLYVRIAFANESPDRIVVMLESFRRTHPANVAGYYYMALFCKQRGMEAEALEWLRKSLYLDPDFVSGHIQMSHLLLASNKNKEYYRTLHNAKKLLKDMDPGLEVPFADGQTAGELLVMLDALGDEK
jgi:chemotaxis protein methyltransferase CheR